MMRDQVPSPQALAPVQQGRAYATAKGIGGQIIQACASPRQVDLVPLVQCTDRYGAEERNGKHPPAPTATRIANGGGQYGKNQGMHQFVPRWRNQTHGYGLRTTNEQAHRQSKRQKNGSPLQTAP
jgi:hypothetical protein